ncbi:hypothetical protein SPRG_21527 [Saprolegnia parasitica CBS 223.65]|uniref:SWIM-type domain-containing protein n=1 Tax=Saprolegnia parasitica (strain CBS 223.65) TaxID=695850 RepID=A0A067BYG1_SAPPC|nr:hypothetical protein SPRG_21527 [Saprolegnia parasitica CBS 223.65]KDO19602.1 hypothetical protein SPRG_21527 [Saprolegnia parasitica CBS 223.65]|eukprot:XP_012209705.1 hypothetical protein SPRG_21527 [Saprolegnia parasitica CBS 223.65]
MDADRTYPSLAAATKAAKEYASAKFPSTEVMVDRTFKQAHAKRLVCRHRGRFCGWKMDILPQGDAWKFVVVDPLHSSSCDLIRQKKTIDVDTMAPPAPFVPMMTPSFAPKKPSVPGATTPMIAHADALGGRPTFALTHEMRWFSAKDASRSVNDYAFFVQKKRARMDKKTSGGRNKKYVCSSDACDWYVRLLKAPKTESWKISSMNLVHAPACTGVAQPSARQLAEMASFRQAVVTHGKQHGKLLTDEFLSSTEDGIKIPLRLAYRAKQMIVVHSKDDVVESYKFLPSLLTMFVAKNPGSIADYDRDADHHFVRAFVMPHASLQAMPALQRILGIDVVPFGRPEYSGAMLLLLGRDGNLQSHVLAVGLVPAPTLEHAAWFLQRIQQGISLTHLPIYVPITHLGIADAIEATGAKVQYCMSSLFECMGNDKHISKLGAVELLIWDLHRQETEQGFQAALSQLESVNPAAALFLRSQNPLHWAMHANRHTKLYQWSTTSFSSELHGPSSESVDEAPFDILYSYLARLMDDVFQKSQTAAKLATENAVLTPGAQELYACEMQEAVGFTTRPCDETLAFVWKTGSRPKVTHRVHLSDLSCSCGLMPQVGIPCRHFIAAARHFGREGLVVNAFDPIYKASTYAMVFHKMRIEIPLENDLAKDETLLPVQAEMKPKAAKKPRKKKSPTNETSAAIASCLDDDQEMMSAMAMGTLGMPNHHHHGIEAVYHPAHHGVAQPSLQQVNADYMHHMHHLNTAHLI